MTTDLSEAQRGIDTMPVELSQSSLESCVHGFGIALAPSKGNGHDTHTDGSLKEAIEITVYSWRTEGCIALY